jgi:uncharacterized protein
MNKNPSNDFIAQLCPQCGLCCNGVLFADVRLQKGDDARRLAKLGLSLRQKGSQPAFPQPCAGFDGALCRIYAVRPQYCRTFECGLLKRVQIHKAGVETALRKIVRAQRLAEKVRQRLRRSGDRNETLALTRRYARIMRKPIDLSGPEEAVAGRGKLMLAVSDLMQALQRDFLSLTANLRLCRRTRR